MRHSEPLLLDLEMYHMLWIAGYVANACFQFAKLIRILAKNSILAKRRNRKS
jgi:hypothetical protein